MKQPTIPPRLKKKDKEIVRSHLEQFGQRLVAAGGATHYEVADWTCGSVGVGVYYGSLVQPRPATKRNDYDDWICAEWSSKDRAWVIRDSGIPVGTEKALTAGLLAHAERLRERRGLRKAWADFKKTRSTRRWQEYLGHLFQVLRVHRGCKEQET